MTQEQKTQKDNNQNRVDKVGETNIYPVSEMDGASDDAKVQDEASFGQGKRGAEGYKDSGTSEIIQDKEIKQAGGSSSNG